ncbi:MAG: hypothetical protein IJW35_03745, partial [Lentisphaeria bacterium]|nr:hypothetical protein [Lentisphaeria bacterium]
MESAGSLNFMGIPIMRMITATTAFKMPFLGISFLLSASSESLTEASIRLRSLCDSTPRQEQASGLSGAKRQTGALGGAKQASKQAS